MTAQREQTPAPPGDGPAGADAVQALATAHRWRPWEALPWLLAVAAVWIFPDYLALGTQVLIAVLFALSLDLILGYAGIITLGHAAYFGAGAYAVALAYSLGGWTEPLSGLALAAAVAGLTGLLFGWVLMRYHGLTLLMLTLAVGILLQELANANEAITGGFDGMALAIAPLLGRFENDLWGHHYYWYALAVLLICFVLARRLVHSAFGRSLVGIRENTRRMHALGVPVHRRLVAVYALSAAMAGVAGALFAQSNAYVTMDVLAFSRSGTILVILILGGIGRLYGAFMGAVVYVVLEEELSKLSPEFWEFGVGAVLIVVVLFARQGLLGLVCSGWARLRRGSV